MVFLESFFLGIMNFESNFIMFLCDVDMVFDADIERFKMKHS